MKRTILFYCFLMGCFVHLWGQAEFANNRLIVKIKIDKTIHYQHIVQQNSFNIVAVDELNRQYQLEKITPIRRTSINRRNPNLAADRTFILHFKQAINIQQAVQAYQTTNYFELVEPDFIGHGDGKCGLLLTPDDTEYDKQWAAYNDGTFSLSNSLADADMDLQEAWEVTIGSSEIVIAILDTGHKLDHTDTNNRIWINGDEIANNADNDMNGFVDDVMGGWDFAYDDNNPTDGHGHGTNVTGLIGANGNNGVGYAGVNWESRLMILKVLDNNSTGLYSWWIAGIYYAVDNGAKVINMSFSGASFSATFEDAINYANDRNVVTVASMGNDNTNAPRYPAAYANTIAVGSTDPDDTRSVPFIWSPTSGSNYGDHIDVVAPGHYMFGLNHLSDSDYNGYWSGTSQAAPMVTGLVSLLKSIDSTQRVSDIRLNFENTAEDGVGNPSEDVVGWDQYYGFGRVNALNALNFSVANTPSIQQFAKTSIFPNPAHTQFTIEVTPQLHDFYTIQLLDGRGTFLKNIAAQNLPVGTHRFHINTSSLPNGFYTITIRTKDGVLAKSLVVTSHN